MGTFFGYYFLGTLLLSGLSPIPLLLYVARIDNYMTAKYPHKYQRMLPGRYFGFLGYLSRVWRTLRAIKNSEDDKAKSLGRIGLFWLICCVSVFITWPSGLVVFLILKALQ
ncbi:MAG: hypothetical protein ACYS0C_09605 [Planctomycetota bacterium]|jgi:hypothetical protein